MCAVYYREAYSTPRQRELSKKDNNKLITGRSFFS
jgi:hypothetical protein